MSKMRGDKCCTGRGKQVKIPLLPENVGKRSLNYLGTLGTLERVTTGGKPVLLFYLEILGLPTML